jgi:O-glycosyl hydrolase
MLKKIFLTAPIIVFILFACAKKKVDGPSNATDPCFVNGVDTCHAIKPLIKINLNNEKQTIDNFGASDGWTTKFIGKWGNTQKKNLIADYLFSLDTTANGNPKGIGLSLWRFNVGAGSFEQGAASGIASDYRREECFLSADGTYDWNKQAGQQWFLNAAKQRRLNNFLAFSISPPVQFTINNKAYGLGTSQLNLKSTSQNDFADFLVNVAQHFNQEGFNMRYLSPFNEPQWNWGDKTPSQEGTGATNTEIANFVKVLGPKLNAANSTTKIALGEAAQWNFLNTSNSDNRGNQLSEFFNPNSTNYIGNVPNLENLLSAHSYFTTCPDVSLIKYRKDAFDAKNQVNPNLRLWQTEFGILGNICDQYNGYPKNTGIDYGLYVAKVIHHDLAIANVSAWQWWLSVDTYNYSDGLIYINDPSGGYDLEAMKTDGIVSDSKQLWCLGNYSRFVRPGMVRVEASLNSVTDDVAAASSQMISAYKDKTTKQLVIVMVNESSSDQKFSIDSSVINLASNKMTAYTTDLTHNLSKSIMDSHTIQLPAKSVVTLVGNYK